MLNKMTIALAAAAFVGSVSAGMAAGYPLIDPELAQFNHQQYSAGLESARGARAEVVRPAAPMRGAWAYSVGPQVYNGSVLTANERSQPWQNNW